MDGVSGDTPSECQMHANLRKSNDSEAQASQQSSRTVSLATPLVSAPVANRIVPLRSALRRSVFSSHRFVSCSRGFVMCRVALFLMFGSHCLGVFNAVPFRVVSRYF